MSEGIQKVSGPLMRRAMQDITKNRFVGIFSGFALTSAIQSSSATTVMVVSFANAGLLNLRQAIGVIMGSNIGTTITGWLIAFFGFHLEIESYTIVFFAFATPLLFLNNNKLKNGGQAFIGFALLFMGLLALKDVVPNLQEQPELLAFLKEYANYGWLSTIVFVFIGAILTVVVQSSSAAMALTLTLLYQDFIAFDMAAAMVVGENIGTTLTANVAAIVGNIHAKRAARSHFLFNLLGVLWIVPLLPFFIELIHFIGEPLQESLKDNFAYEQKQEILLALFHTLFNVCNTVLLVGFVGVIAQMSEKLVPAKTGEEEFSLRYINTGIVSTAEIAIAEVRKEVEGFGDLVQKMYGNIYSLLFLDPRRKGRLVEKIKAREGITDTLQEEINSYLSGISTHELSAKSSKDIRDILGIVDNMERIGDTIYKMAVLYERLQLVAGKFPEHGRNDLEGLFKKVQVVVKQMTANLKVAPSTVHISEVYVQEEHINQLRDELVTKHYHNLEKNRYGTKEGILFLEYINLAEKIGDYVVNVNESIVGIK